MFSTQRVAQFGLGAVSLVLALCMGVLIANGIGDNQPASGSPADVMLIGSEGCSGACEASVTNVATVSHPSAPVQN